VLVKRGYESVASRDPLDVLERKLSRKVRQARKEGFARVLFVQVPSGLFPSPAQVRGFSRRMAAKLSRVSVVFLVERRLLSCRGFGYRSIGIPGSLELIPPAELIQQLAVVEMRGFLRTRPNLAW